MILRNIHALLFVTDDSLAKAAEAVANDMRLSRSRVEILRGGVLDAANWLSNNPSPDVLVVADSVDDGVWDRLEALANTVEPGCRVIVLGAKDSIAIFRDMTGRGVADYLGGDVQGSEIADSICRLFVVEDSLPKGKAVAVISAVGGAGGSTVAAVLTTALGARFGDAILLDLDLGEGTGALMMGMDPRDPLGLALHNQGLDAAMLERFMARAGACRVLSTPGSLREAFTLDADTAERVLSVARSMSKAVVVDLPKGWSEAYCRIAALADEVVVVARPDLASLRNARMIVDEVVAKRVDGRRPKLVVNGTGALKKAEYGAADFTEAVGVAPSCLLPFDPEPLLAAMMDGRSVAQAGGKVAPAIHAFANTLLAVEGAKAAPKKKMVPTERVARLRAWLNGVTQKEKG